MIYLFSSYSFSILSFSLFLSLPFLRLEHLVDIQHAQLYRMASLYLVHNTSDDGVTL